MTVKEGGTWISSVGVVQIVEHVQEAPTATSNLPMPLLLAAAERRSSIV